MPIYKSFLPNINKIQKKKIGGWEEAKNTKFLSLWPNSESTPISLKLWSQSAFPWDYVFTN